MIEIDHLPISPDPSNNSRMMVDSDMDERVDEWWADWMELNT